MPNRIVIERMLIFQLLDSFYTTDSKVAVLVFELMHADLGVSFIHNLCIESMIIILFEQRLIHCTDNRYSSSHIKTMVRMMLSGLDYIHSCGIMHQVELNEIPMFLLDDTLP